MTNKNKILSRASIAAIIAILLVWTPSAVYAGIDETFICDTSVINQTIDANIVVPKDAVCDLDTVIVNGNINIEQNATLETEDSTFNGDIEGTNGCVLEQLARAIVNGNISMVNCEGVNIDDQNEINGNVLIQGATVFIFNSEINGNLIIVRSEDVLLEGPIPVEGNVSILRNNIVVFDDDIAIGGNLKVLNNGEVKIEDTTVDGNATCVKNDTLTGDLNTYNGRNKNCPL